MVCGILAHKSKRRAAQTEPLLLFLCSKLYMAAFARSGSKAAAHPSRGFSFGPQVSAPFMTALTRGHAGMVFPARQMIFDVIGDPRR
jgi:hypothetical protein